MYIWVVTQFSLFGYKIKYGNILEQTSHKKSGSSQPFVVLSPIYDRVVSPTNGTGQQFVRMAVDPEHPHIGHLTLYLPAPGRTSKANQPSPEVVAASNQLL